MRLYDDGKVGKALEPHFVETHAGNLHVYEDRTQVGDIVFITTDKFKKYIPIEWIEEWGWKNGMSESMSLRVMIDDWEKENEVG